MHILSVIMVTAVYAECHNYFNYAECRYAKCHHAECLYAKCHSVDCSGVICLKHLNPILKFRHKPTHKVWYSRLGASVTTVIRLH